MKIFPSKTTRYKVSMCVRTLECCEVCVHTSIYVCTQMNLSIMSMSRYTTGVHSMDIQVWQFDNID